MGRAARKWQLRRVHLIDGVPAMPQPNDLSRSLVALDQNSTIMAVIEMSQSSWLVAGMLPGIGADRLQPVLPDRAAGQTERQAKPGGEAYRHPDRRQPDDRVPQHAAEIG